MRCGIPASQTSSAERGEFGSTSAKSKFPARNFRPTENTFSPGAREIISFTAGWASQRSRSFSGVSSVMCASGNFSRRRSSAGVVITASPSQFVPRTRMRRGGILKDTLMSVFPAAMNPEPVGGIAAHGGLQGAIHVAHDFFGRTRLAVFVRGNFFAEFQPPFRQCDAVTNLRVKFRVVTQRENGGREAGVAIAAEKRRAQAFGALVGEQAENDAALFHPAAKGAAIGAAFKKKTAAADAQILHKPVERGLVERAIGRRSLIAGQNILQPRVKFEVAEVADGDDDVAWRRIAGFLRQAFVADEFKMRAQFLETHRGSFDGGQIVFADAANIFVRDGVNFFRRFFLAETQRQIIQHHAAMASVEMKRQRTARTAKPRDELQRQNMDERDERASQPVEKRVHQRKQILRTQS